MLITNFINFIQSKGNYNPKTILDVGSRDLGQSIEFHTIWPSAFIHAFEPNPDQYEICKLNSVNIDNVNVYQLAIGDRKDTVDFYKTIGNIGASSLLEPIDVPFASTQQTEKILVQQDTLSNWMKEFNIPTIDIIWMDTQGTELAALRGMGSNIKNVKFIHCEASPIPYYKGHTSKNDLEQFLTENGFEYEFHPSPHPYGEGDIFAINTTI